MLTNFPVNVKAPAAAAVLGDSGLVHGYFRYAVGTRNPCELLSLWWQIVRWKPQVLVYMGASRGVQAARRDASFFRLCGIGRLIGVPMTEEMQQNRWQESEQALEPEAARLARNLAELGDGRLDDPASWDLHLTAEEHARASEALQPAAGRPIIAVSVGTKVQANDWGHENWYKLLAQLSLIYSGYALVVVGAPIDTQPSELVAEGWRQASASVHGGPVLNLCGHLTPRESAAVFARASLYIGHDSGPLHLAATVQTSCVGIFSARNKPRVWFPYGRKHRVLYHQTDCWGCKLETCIVERKKCITSITVPEVLAEVRAVLG
jgi:ADP-heptose:LPS heptosyltransferase